MHEDITRAYGAQIDNMATLLTSIRTNQAYASIKIPLKKVETGFVLDTEHRIFQEDIPYGLDFLLEMAKRLDVKVPHIEEITHWARSLMGSTEGSIVTYFPEDL